jgi:hypothetical protein
MKDDLRGHTRELPHWIREAICREPACFLILKTRVYHFPRSPTIYYRFWAVHTQFRKASTPGLIRRTQLIRIATHNIYVFLEVFLSVIFLYVGCISSRARCLRALFTTIFSFVVLYKLCNFIIISQNISVWILCVVAGYGMDNVNYTYLFIVYLTAIFQ